MKGVCQKIIATLSIQGVSGHDTLPFHNKHCSAIVKVKCYSEKGGNKGFHKTQREKLDILINSGILSPPGTVELTDNMPEYPINFLIGNDILNIDMLS